MSDENPQKLFLTEQTSNMDEANSQRRKSRPKSGVTTGMESEVNEVEDGDTSLNDDEDDDDSNDDDYQENEYDESGGDSYSDEADDEDYINPFSQYLPLKHKQPDPTANPDDEEKNKKDDIDENRPLSPLAPKHFDQDELQVEISATPAFQCLEELFQAGKLTGTQVAQLKAKYVELHLTLKKSRENEAQLLKESKECLKKLDENKEVLQKAEAFPDNLTTEVLKIRAQYLKYENDAACSEERLYNLEYKLAGYLNSTFCLIITILTPFFLIDWSRIKIYLNVSTLEYRNQAN